MNISLFTGNKQKIIVNKKPLLFLWVPIVLMLILGRLEVLASDENINISAGSITGVYAQYRFNIPSFWDGYVLAERYQLSGQGVEEVKIYCRSVTEKVDPVLLLSFRIYETRTYYETQSHDLVIKAKYYTIGVNRGLRQPFKNEVDKGVYTNCYKYIDTYEKLKALFEFPEGQGEIPKNSLFVKGKNLGEIIITKNKVNYIPMRQVCEELGYVVTYLPYSHGVRVTKPNFSDTFFFSNNSDILYLLENGKTYISTAYFYRVLGASIELDNNNNIYIG